MARITVEDCLEVVRNRFELVLYAAKRAREISAGASITVPRNNDKNPVIALREIAERTIDVNNIKESLIRSMQRNVVLDEDEDDIEDNFERTLAEAGSTTDLHDINMDRDEDDDDMDDVAAAEDEGED